MRDLIFDEAIRLFATRGYSGASMRELARRCDTSASNVYNYFPSKQVLLEKIFARGADQIRETIVAGQGAGRVDLEAYLQSVIDTLRANTDLWKLIHQLRLDDQVRTTLRTHFTELIELITGELGVYTEAPWLLLALVDGLASSIVQGIPLPADHIIVDTTARAIRAAVPN